MSFISEYSQFCVDFGFEQLYYAIFPFIRPCQTFPLNLSSGNGMFAA